VAHLAGHEAPGSRRANCGADPQAFGTNSGRIRSGVRGVSGALTVRCSDGNIVPV
jgi:hypothetical protein